MCESVHQSWFGKVPLRLYIGFQQSGMVHLEFRCNFCRVCTAENSNDFFFQIKKTYFRGISVGIYTTNSAEACYYCAENSRANIIVVQDDKQLEKIQEIRHRLPKLKAVIQYEGEPSSPDVLSVSSSCFNNFTLLTTHIPVD